MSDRVFERAIGRRPGRGPIIVAADLDGTLSFESVPPGPAVMAMLEELTERPDVRLVIATSRAPRGVRRLLGALTDRVELLCCNGALHVGLDGRVRRIPLPAPLVEQMVGELRDTGDDFCIDHGEWFLASSADALPWMGTLDRFLLADWSPLQGAVKLSVAAGTRWLVRFRDLAGGAVELYLHARDGDLDVTPGGVTKASALERILGADHAPILAVGNDANDAELLAAADAAIVVGDTLADVGRATRRVAADGVSVAGAIFDELDGLAVA